MYNVPTEEPTQVVAGDSWRWKRSFPDFPVSEGWTLTYSLTGLSDVANVVAAVSGQEFEVNMLPATTAPILPGTYQWIARVSKGAGAAAEAYTVANGVISVFRDLAAVTTALQSHAEKTLALIVAAIEGRIPADMQAYQIAGRAVTKIPIVELVRLRAIYAAEVYQERNPGVFGRPVRASFAASS